MPTVSIVLPTYNGEKYIKYSIESILNQSFRDWELIVVDDCSTDNTKSIVEKYSAIDSRIRLLHNEVNKKLPASLNIGFREAKGEYFTWTSDDNIYQQDAISEMVSVLDNNCSIPMVVSNMVNIDEDGNEFGEKRVFDMDTFVISNSVGACFLYRRSVMEKVGNYDEQFFLAEDYEYWMRIYKECGVFAHIDKVLYQYRVHGNSLSTRREGVILKTNELRIKYFDFIISSLSGNKENISRLYFEMSERLEINGELKNKFCELVPELSRHKKYDNEKIIVYGAGQIGDIAYEKYAENIEMYCDKNPSRYGHMKNDKPIISIEEMLERQSEFGVMIAVSNRIKYEVIHELIHKGLNEYYAV